MKQSFFDPLQQGVGTEENGKETILSPLLRTPLKPDSGVLPLDRETYGTSAYAFLPLQERALTEEEMLQLAWGMEGAFREELLKPEHARTGLFSYDGANACLQTVPSLVRKRRRCCA